MTRFNSCWKERVKNGEQLCESENKHAHEGGKIKRGHGRKAQITRGKGFMRKFRKLHLFLTLSNWYLTDLFADNE